MTTGCLHGGSSWEGRSAKKQLCLSSQHLGFRTSQSCGQKALTVALRPLPGSQWTSKDARCGWSGLGKRHPWGPAASTPQGTKELRNHCQCSNFECQWPLPCFCLFLFPPVKCLHTLSPSVRRLLLTLLGEQHIVGPQ